MSTLAGLSKKANKKALPWGQSKDKSTGSKMSFSLASKSSTAPAPAVKRSVLSKSKSEREKEDRKKTDAEATAEVYAEFVASFEETPTGQGKAFVRGNVINADKDDSGMRKGALYKPSSRISESLKEKALSQVSSGDTGSGILGAFPGESLMKPKRPKEKEKSKSNLELFKEELKREQEERDERHKLKKTLQQEAVRIGSTPMALQKIMAAERETTGFGGSHDHGDPKTTNLYVGNLSPQMNEELLCLTFGKYGPLASVKIMWPRTDEEKSRNRMCGFVAFMCRADGGEALDALNGKEVMGFELKMGWGKAVPIPPVPFYVAPELQSTVAATMPPPPSGKAFNAQPKETVKPGARRSSSMGHGAKGHDDSSEDLRDLVIPVVIPHDKNLLCVIHRVIEFVVREGPMFEAMIMNKELNNPMFRFLFDNKEPAHIYYRWKLCSILQGERPDKWRLTEFSMFKGGSTWRPPPLPQLKTTLKAPVIEDSKSAVVVVVEKKGQLPEKYRDQLEEMLHKISCDKKAIADGMLFCLDHADCAEEIVECIAESLSILETPIPLKAARIYLVSDILYNCSAGVQHASHFRRGFESRLVEVFQHLHAAYKTITGRFRADKFRQQVTTCIRAWEECAVYPPMFLSNLREIFLGQEEQGAAAPDVDGAPIEDIDGIPASVNVEDVGGVDLDGAPLELDGEPVDDGEDEHEVDFTERIPAAAAAPPAAKRRSPEPPRMLSKWEMVDDGAEDEEETPNLKLPTPMQPVRSSGTSSRGEASSSVPIPPSRSPIATPHQTSSTSSFGDQDTEEKRHRLREIEVKVMEYADRLEAKAKRRGKSSDIQAELEKYRQDLLREYETGSESDDGSHYNLVDEEAERKSHSLTSSSRPTSSHVSSSRQSTHRVASHRSRSVSSSSRSPSPSGTSSDFLHSKRKHSHSPSSSRKPKRAKSPPRKSRSPSRHSKRRSRSRSRSPSPNTKRRKHNKSSASNYDHTHSSSRRRK